MQWQRDLVGLLAGLLISATTTPVGVSGAVFLLPVQMTLLHIPSPQITPTNLLFNVVAGPGALLRYFRQQQLDGPLTRQLVIGSAPGVVVGAVLRVYVVADPHVFRLVAAAVLLPTGLLILTRRTPGTADPSARRPLHPRTVTMLAFVVGVVGGIYGIGGGSVLGPLLVGAGMAVTVVAPAALASTFATSLAGVATYAVLALNAPGRVSPDWSLGVSCGIGGLVGGYVGAWLQPHVPERRLRLLLGVLACGLSMAFVVQAIVE